MKRYRIKQFGLLWWVGWIFVWTFGIAVLWLGMCAFAAIPVSYAKSEPIDIYTKEEQANKIIELQKEMARIEEEKRLANLTIEERIIETCEKYGIQHDIPVAISKLETGHYKSAVCKQYNNVGGMMYKGKPIIYDSIEEGVDSFVKNLAQNYFAKGLTTVEAISKKYNPYNSDTWTKVVNQLL